MLLTLGAPSSGTSPVSHKFLRVPLEALLFFALALPAISAQGVTIPFREDDFVFSNSPNYEFERICQYQGLEELNHLEWLLNGTVFMNGTVGATPLQLLINPVTLAHTGLWECRAVFSDGTISSSANAGTLTVYDTNDVIVPPQQSALIGQSYTLDCSSDIEGVYISWQRDGQQAPSAAPLTISSVQLSDEGLYHCRVSINGASISKPVQFNVIIPPRILSQPPRSAFSNEQVTLTVTLESHQESTTSVRWFKNNIPISSTNITTRYGPAPNATTELRFQQITRDDRGRYRVEIENTAEVIPSGMRNAVTSFEVDVTVPPSTPTDVTVDRINDTHVRIRWTLTNLTADAGAEVLRLHLQDHPNSPFELDPNQEEWILSSEPGTMFNLTLEAINPDGTATTDPMAVKFPATAPSVEKFRALRVNDTTFNFTLEVFYTGGGDIEQFIIQLQQSGSSTFITVTTVAPVQSQTSPRLWYAVVVDPDVFDGLEDPQFNINIVNSMQQNVTAAALGEVVLPGAPSIFFISRSSDSLTIQIQLSDIGTAPIVAIEVIVTLSSQLTERIGRNGNFIQGELINVTVTDLQPGTKYTFRSRAVNEFGTGNISMEFQFTTGFEETAEGYRCCNCLCLPAAIVCLLFALYF